MSRTTWPTSSSCSASSAGAPACRSWRRCRAGRRWIWPAPHHPGLILLDLHLPDIPGDEVLARLLEDPETRDIPVVILSADATPVRIERLLTQGARSYLTKPFDVAELLALFDANLS